jgi:hypothetical protein
MFSRAKIFIHLRAATVPTLVVPKEQSLLADVENTYKAIRDTKVILNLHEKRSSRCTNLLSTSKVHR